TKPQGQRQATVLKDRPGGNRALVVTTGTAHKTVGLRPALRLAAARAPKTVRPTKLKQVLPARRFRRKACLQLRQISRIILHGQKHYRLWLRESSKYPSAPIIGGAQHGNGGPLSRRSDVIRDNENACGIGQLDRCSLNDGVYILNDVPADHDVVVRVHPFDGRALTVLDNVSRDRVVGGSGRIQKDANAFRIPDALYVRDQGAADYGAAGDRTEHHDALADRLQHATANNRAIPATHLETDHHVAGRKTIHGHASDRRAAGKSDVFRRL